MTQKITFSPHQEAIFDFAKNGTGHAIVSAVAGSGKTFTLTETMKLISGDCVFLAFNKSIADELAKKCPPHVMAKTLHGLGFAILKAAFGNIKVDSRKLDIIMNEIPELQTYSLTRTERSDLFKKRAAIKKIVGICKSTLTNIDNVSDIISTCDMYGMECEEDMIPLFQRVMRDSIETTIIIDFDDMIYLPVVLNLRAPKFDYVFVDECQDLNRCQIELVLCLIHDNSRVFAVGDPNQSIYGFRGADNEAMDRVKRALNATELPLNVCYRCPKTHVAMAKRLVPHIESCEQAIEGEIAQCRSKSSFADAVRSTPDTLVICRLNASLVEWALSLIGKGIRATIRGRDIGKNLVGIVKSQNAKSLDELFTKINRWEKRELAKLVKRKAPESTMQQVEDKAEAIRLIADNDHRNTPSDVVACIERLFHEGGRGVVFSTVHKAKGLEADSVYILRPDLLPLRYKNQKDWELQQELNIEYVAYTRAKKTLTFIRTSED